MSDYPLLKLRPQTLNTPSPWSIAPVALWCLSHSLHGGEALVYPRDTRRAGQAIKQGRGIVFFNGVDRAWQAAQGNGEDCIIINDVTPSQADALLAKYHALRRQKSRRSTLIASSRILAYAKDELGIVDFYNKSAHSVQRDTQVMDAANPFFMEVSKPELHHALYVPDAFVFDGPVQQVYPHGAVMVSNGKRCWGVGTEVFLRGYRAVQRGQERILSSVETDFVKAKHVYQV